MKSILKVIFLSIYRKKGRSLMLIVSILFSVGLIYTVLSLSSVYEEVIINEYKKEYGNSNVIVYKDDGTFIDEGLNTDDVSFDYLIEGYNIYGYTSIDGYLGVNAFGYTSAEIDLVYELEFVDKLNVGFSSNYVIIGEKNADKYNIEINDPIIVTLFGEPIEFIVYGIAYEGSSFLDYSLNTFDIIVDKDFIKSELSLNNPNIYLFKSSSKDFVDVMINNNESLIVLDIYNQEGLLQDVEGILIAIAVMASSLILVSGFIIFSTFKIIVIDRMPFIGTLRSLGATKKMATKVLIYESIVYGLIGSIVGVIVGVVILFLFSRFFFESQLSEGIDIKLWNTTYALYTVLAGVLLSIVSSIIPIIKSVNYSIKDIIFKRIKNIRELKMVNAILGFVMIGSGFVIMNNVGTHDYLTFSLVSIILAVGGVVLVIPVMVKVVIPVINFILYPIFKNNALIASKNISNDKTLINNIILLATGLGFIFMINSFSADVGRSVGELYDDAAFDLTVMWEDINSDFVDSIIDVEGVDNVYANKVTTNVETTNGFELMFLEGIEPSQYQEYAWDVFKGELTEEMIDEFNTTNAIIITSFTAKKYEIDVGDEIEIVNDSSTYSVNVIAIFSTLLWNGTVNFINEDLFDEIFDIDTYQYIYINSSSDLDIVKREIKETYSFGILPIITLDEMESVNETTNNIILALMRAISILAMLIGSIGIINNFMVSFISRRKLIANLRSLGLSKKGTVKLFMIESLIIGLIGSSLGVVFGIILYQFMAFVIEGINITSDIVTYGYSNMVFVFISGLLLSVVTSILPALNMSKRNIVSEIKYE